MEKELPGVKKNVLLKNYTTFKIGGPAKYFFVAKSKEDLIRAIKAAEKLNLPFFILGGGSNLLVADKGFKGLIIKMQNVKCKIQGNEIFSEAGKKLGELVSFSTKEGLKGFEWAAGIPGTVGGAVKGNSGAFGKSIKGIVKKIEIYDTAESKIKNYNLKDCKFGYRNSVFKKKPDLILLSATFKLKKGKKEKIKKEISEILKKRKEKAPIGFSVGSVFKNPSGNSAGFLIEKCKLKGKKIGKAKISEKHGNFIINLGKAKAKDVEKLIKLIKQRVKKKFNIELEEEIQYLGF
ncbi:UDP-N-acetylmuramate dehydrogenase [Patescibacteria group bacterium]